MYLIMTHCFVPNIQYFCSCNRLENGSRTIFDKMIIVLKGNWCISVILACRWCLLDHLCLLSIKTSLQDFVFYQITTYRRSLKLWYYYWLVQTQNDRYFFCFYLCCKLYWYAAIDDSCWWIYCFISGKRKRKYGCVCEKWLQYWGSIGIFQSKFLNISSWMIFS